MAGPVAAQTGASSAARENHAWNGADGSGDFGTSGFASGATCVHQTTEANGQLAATSREIVCS